MSQTNTNPSKINLTIIPSGDPNLDRFQHEVSAAFQNLFQNVPILQGRLLEKVVLKPEEKKIISHGLQRSWRGWLVTRTDNNIMLIEPDRDALYPRDKHIILLNPSMTQTVTVDLWVF